MNLWIAALAALLVCCAPAPSAPPRPTPPLPAYDTAAPLAPTDAGCPSPAPTELPGDGLDQDGDGRDACYADADGDGWGAPPLVFAPPAGCDRGYGAASRGGDCDDTNALIHPEAVWHRDEDGDGLGDPWVVTQGCTPGAPWTLDARDCDDTDPRVGARVWYLDADHDGRGDPAIFREGCAPRADEVADGSDCDDDDPSPCAAAP